MGKACSGISNPSGADLYLLPSGAMVVSVLPRVEHGVHVVVETSAASACHSHTWSKQRIDGHG